MFHWLGSKRWVVPVLLALFTVFFYWRILLTNRASFPWDALDFFYPALSFVHEELRHLHLPLWNSFLQSGFPAIADPEAQIFYPPTWLLVIFHPFGPLPFKLMEAELIAHFFLGGLFMYWLVKDFTRDTASALFGGVLFMSSGAMVAHTEHVASIEAMSWYPLAFLFARRALFEKKWFWTVSAGCVLGLENLTGHWQHAVYLGLLLFLYFAYEASAERSRRQLWPGWIVRLLAIGAIGVCIAMIQIVPSMELGGLSIRTQLTYYDITGSEAHPSYLWTLVFPNYFGGLNGVPYSPQVEPSFNHLFITVPGFLLALVGLIEMARRRNFFWPALILLTAELSLGRAGFLGGLVFRTPVLNLFRNMTVFIDLANFGICLMAAAGLGALLDADSRRFYRRWLPLAVTAMIPVAAGLRYALAWKFHDWYHALAVLALFSALVALWMKDRLPTSAACAAILALVVFELCFYNMNQAFNRSNQNPRTNVSHDHAAYIGETLAFLRRDASSDFRVAALDGPPWGSNGCSIWRIPCVFGWNPVTLRGYRDYVRQFIQVDMYTQPFGGQDHRMESPLLDLLGVKYLLANDEEAAVQKLSESRKFRKTFSELTWRSVYRNDDYVSRTWFYPHAYVLPDREVTLALMNSRWFRARQTLLFTQGEVPMSVPRLIERVETLTLRPSDVAASSKGSVAQNLNCAVPRPYFDNWGANGSWIRFNVTPPRPGRFALLMEYNDAWTVAPIVDAQIAQGEHRDSTPALVLPHTTNWDCNDNRIAELGQFDLQPGMAQITLTLRQNTPLQFYTLWLVRLPENPAHVPVPQTVDFSFGPFESSANRIAFQADLKQNGFVLLNEINYPGWEATLDGKPAQLLTADTIFRSLMVPAGAHRIEMRFHSRYLWIGALISLLTVLALASYFLAHGQPSSYLIYLKPSAHEKMH